MVSRKQIELLGGGYYDPVFTIIPGADRIGQIEYLTTYLRKRFGRRPRGSWITCGVWEPTLATSMRNSGIEYTFLDEAYFPMDGLDGMEKCVPCITEDQGKSIMVFPLTSSIGNRIPADTPEKVVEAVLEYSARKKDHIVSIIMPGSAFSTSRTETAGWLEEFIALIHDRKERIELFQPFRFGKAETRLKKVYFSGSGGTDGGIAGGFRNNLSRLYNSGLLYSKMIYAHNLVNQMRGDKYRKRTAREEIWKGQNHYPYWESGGTGIQRNQTRKAAYSALIEAEKMTREKGIFKPSIIATDFDMDGLQEFLYQGDDLNVYTHQEGGMIFEIDYLPKLWNYLDVFTENKQKTDLYRRGAFIDHFLAKECGLEDFISGAYTELGDFIYRNYAVMDKDKDRNTLLLSASGKLHVGNQCYTLFVEKKYAFSASGIAVSIRIVNTGDKRFSCRFGSETNLSFGGDETDFFQVFTGEGEMKNEFQLNSGTIGNVQNLQIDDKRNHIYITFQTEKPAEAWLSTHSTAPQIYQGTCFLFNWDIALNRQEEWTTGITLSFAKKRGKKAPAAI